MVTRPQPPIALTMGDPAGISPEIIVKLITSLLPVPVVVYGDRGALVRAAASLGLSEALAPILKADPEAVLAGASAGDGIARAKVAIKQCGPVLPDNFTLGEPSALGGETAFQALITAIDDTLAGRTHAVVTAPLHKVSLKLAGHDYPGHTEILADRTQSRVAMVLANGELRIILATIHVALRDVPSMISIPQQLQTYRLAHEACLQMGVEKPRIAVAGLNPHAGEAGRFGDEEIRFIQPAIEAARQAGLDVTGPYPGDTVYMRARQGHFDIVVSQYHDQGLIPIKYLGVDEGVNITVGLPIIRTSVDHGTAFDIAGKGIASPDSLRAALNMAIKMHRPSERGAIRQ